MRYQVVIIGIIKRLCRIRWYMIIPLRLVCYVKSYHEQAADACSQLFDDGGMFDSCLCMGVCISDQPRPLSCPRRQQNES